MITASKPENFNSGPQKPPASASPYPPVSGDLAATVKRTIPAIGTPEITEEAKIRILSADRGSIPGLSSLSR